MVKFKELRDIDVAMTSKNLCHEIRDVLNADFNYIHALDLVIENSWLHFSPFAQRAKSIRKSFAEYYSSVSISGMFSPQSSALFDMNELVRISRDFLEYFVHFMEESSFRSKMQVVQKDNYQDTLLSFKTEYELIKYFHFTGFPMEESYAWLRIPNVLENTEFATPNDIAESKAALSKVYAIMNNCDTFNYSNDAFKEYVEAIASKLR